MICIDSVFRSYKTECPAEIYVSADRDKNKLVIQRMVIEHNHEVSSKAFQLYPEQRRLSTEAQDEVKRMLESGVKVSHIRDHFREQVCSYLGLFG